MKILKRGLTNIEICNHLKYEKTFLGCFPSNKTPTILKYPCSIILNTEKSGESGEHWIGLYLEKYHSFYFDSFGLPVLEDDIFNFLKKKYKKVIYNKHCIQDISSVSCGLYCISFVKHVNSEKSFKKFLKHFSINDLKQNDMKVLNLI